MKTVQHVLETKGSAVHTVSPQTSVYDALRLMAEHDVGALVVIEGGRLVGILSERDYARKVVLLGRVSRETPVREIMTPEVVRVGPQDGVEACMALMTQRRIRHLPVLEGDRLAGIVSIGDVVKSIIGEQQFTIEQLQRYIQGVG
jgi:CBS domain-containing protein